MLLGRFAVFVEPFTMYTNQQHLIAAPAAPSAGPAAAAAPPAGREKLEPRFAAMLEGADVDVKTMDAFGTVGLRTLAVFTGLGKDDEKLRAFLKKPPIDLDEDKDVMSSLEVAKLVSVWEAAKTTIHVENEAKAQRQNMSLPPRVGDKEVANLRSIFETSFFKLDDVMIPSDGYFERKVGQMEKVWEAEPLTDITNVCQKDVNRNAGVAWDNGTNQFKTVEKRFGVPLPDDSEGLRARLRTLGISWHFLKLRNPNKPELATASYEVLDRYTEWLLGPEVWGMATKDKTGKPVSTPHLDHVLIYDYELRKMVAKLMNTGTDIRSAFGIATADDKLHRQCFLNNVTLEIASGKCRSITAPGMKEVHAGVVSSAPNQGAKRGLEDASEGLSKSQLNKIKVQAKKQALADAKRQLALVAPPPGDLRAYPPRPPGQGVSRNALKRQARQQGGGQGAGRGAPLALQNGGVGDGQKGAGKGAAKGGEGACYA